MITMCACACKVCAVAEKVIWECLVEEPTLFLRVFLEKLTHRDKQDELIFLLRKLLYFVESLPAQTAHSLFNYIVSSAGRFKFTVFIFFASFLSLLSSSSFFLSFLLLLSSFSLLPPPLLNQSVSQSISQSVDHNY